MLLGAGRRGEAEVLGNLAQGRRDAATFDDFLDVVEDLALAIGEKGHRSPQAIDR